MVGMKNIRVRFFGGPLDDTEKNVTVHSETPPKILATAAGRVWAKPKSEILWDGYLFVISLGELHLYVSAWNQLEDHASLAMYVATHAGACREE